jgi:hypothetical protein
MPVCDINVSRRSNATFTDAETQWLSSHLPEFQRINGKQKLKDDQGRATIGAASPFLDRLCDAFFKAFPYRNAALHKDWVLTPDQKALVMSSKEIANLSRVRVAYVYYVQRSC